LKITEVKTFLVNATRQNWVFVKVLTDEGLYGWGEASVEGQEKAVEAAIHTLAERSVIGEDPSRVDYIWQKMYRHGFWKGGFIYNSAISGIDMAIWDIKGKALGVPVYDLLGGRVRDKIKTYTHGNETNAAELIAKGFAGLKTGVGSGTPEAAVDNPLTAPRRLDARLQKIRDIVGPDKHICIDHHGQGIVKDAMALIKVAANYDLYFFEEPVSPENSQLYRELVRNPYNIPIAAGERLYSRFDYRDVIANQWLDIIQPDITHCGGISEIRKIGFMAEPYLIRFAPHNPNGPVATAASIQVCAAAQNFDILEFAQTVYTRKDIFEMDLNPTDGYFALPTKPGLGIEMDESAFAKYPYSNFQYTARYKVDGSVAEI
jgi:galactonate dehydratase